MSKKKWSIYNIVIYYIEWVTTSWTYSIYLQFNMKRLSLKIINLKSAQSAYFLTEKPSTIILKCISTSFSIFLVERSEYWVATGEFFAKVSIPVVFILFSGGQIRVADLDHFGIGSDFKMDVTG